MIQSSLDLLPSYRKVYDEKLKGFIESFMTQERIAVLHKILPNRTRHITLVAERLLDEHNIHALIRTSESLGLQDFHNIPYQNAILKRNKSVTRGAFQWTHIYHYHDIASNSLECITHLRTKGYKIYASSSNIKSHYTPFNVPIETPLAIIMGNEHRGISEDVMENIDGIISIPMYGFTESFNVSVAGSLIAQPIVERLRTSKVEWSLSELELRNLYFEWIWNNVKNPDVLYKEWLVQNS